MLRPQTSTHKVLLGSNDLGKRVLLEGRRVTVERDHGVVGRAVKGRYFWQGCIIFVRYCTARHGFLLLN